MAPASRSAGRLIGVAPWSRFRRAVREGPLHQAPNGGPAIVAASLARWRVHCLPPAPV